MAAALRAGGRFRAPAAGLEPVVPISTATLEPLRGSPRNNAPAEAGGSQNVVAHAAGTITVCHPVARLDCGGLEKQLAQIIARLPAARFRHIVVVREGETTCCLSPSSQTGAATVETQPRAAVPHPPCGTGILPVPFASGNVDVISQQRAGRDRLWLLRLASILRRHRVDVLHVRGLSMLVDSVLAARLARRVKVAFSFHGFESAPDSGPRFGRLRSAAYRAAARHGEDRWAVSRAAAEAVARELSMSPDEFAVLPNGVDTDQYAPALDRLAVRRRLDLPDDRLIVLSVGNLKPIKGHDVLLEALAALGDDARRLCLVLAGRDYLGGELQRRAREQLPSIDVRFVGHQEDTLPWYQAADIFVLPSRWEGMSNALLEAMACDLPAVATEVGGNTGVIATGRTGLLVEPNNPVEMACALRLLMKDEALRASLGAAARRQVVEHHSAVRTAANYEQRYANLAARLAPPLENR
jgi:glycosyltransferase involved in cell wall biosynthesis